MPIAMTQGSDKFYLHYDQVGSLRAITDNSHNIVKEISYDTFGNVLTDSNPSFKVPFGFAGGLYDVDTKLTRFGYRDYDAYTGKWTAKDPIGFDGGDSNLYGYVLGDPVNFIDSEGLAKSQGLCKGKKNLNTEGFNKQSKASELERALNDAINKKQSKRIKALEALLKVIKRGGSMGLLFPILRDQFNSSCSCDKQIACELIDKEPTCVN